MLHQLDILRYMIKRHTEYKVSIISIKSSDNIDEMAITQFEFISISI